MLGSFSSSLCRIKALATSVRFSRADAAAVRRIPAGQWRFFIAGQVGQRIDFRRTRQSHQPTPGMFARVTGRAVGCPTRQFDG